jgi:hypothetical protein
VRTPALHGEAILELDEDAPRLARIRRDNVHNAALRHDWVHRVRAVFEALGIPPTEAMLAREKRLETLAALALGGPVAGDPAGAAVRLRVPG